MKPNTDTLTITPEILTLIAGIDEFKGSWRALGAIVLMIASLSVLILLVAYFTGGLSHSAMATG